MIRKQTGHDVMSNSVAVTGAAGFVGGQTMIALKAAGYKVLGIDKKRLPNHLKSFADYFMQEDYASGHALEGIFRQQPVAIVHCAATSLVGPSIKDPATYYENNVVKTKSLLDFVLRRSLRSKVIVSSSSSVYGNPDTLPCTEFATTRPVSPYGESKLMIDMMLQSYAVAYGLDSVSLRYFNVCGADPECRHGQAPGATHIIARVLESLRDDAEFTLNGNDYDTPDGTCVRDHVHVWDVAHAHVMSISKDFDSGIYNVGLGEPVSNRDVIKLAQKVTGRELRLTTADRRAGDPAMLQADAAKLRAQGWTPKYTLEDMIAHAWKWCQH